MSTLTSTPEVTRYLEAVRRHLADLPADDRDGLLEDLDDHLAEVAAEHGLPLERRLGEPAAFAAELRASAGLGGAPPEAAGSRANPVRSLLASLWASPTWEQVRAFLPELRPGWWVLRGYLAVTVLAALGSGADLLRTFPVPALGGSPVVGLLALMVAIPASVALGRRALESGRRTLDRVATGLAALGLVALVLFGLGGVHARSSVAWYPVTGHVPGGNFLHDAEGRPITNIYAYDSDGRLLEGVRLYDQDGRPLDDVAPVTDDGRSVEHDYRLDANGAPMTNAYPLDARIVDPWERPGGARRGEPMRPPAVVVPPPAPTTTTPTTAG